MEGGPRDAAAGWAIAVAVAAAPACFLAVVTGLAGADGSVPATGQIVARTLARERLTIVDRADGEVRQIAMPQLAPGDPPFELAARDGAVVFTGWHDGRRAVYALLGDSVAPRWVALAWYFVPASDPASIWLAERDPRSPDTERSLSRLRRVDPATGHVIATSERPPAGPIAGAAGESLIVSGRSGLVLWNPHLPAGRARTLGGRALVAASSTRVALCRRTCAVIRIRDTRSGRERVVRPPAGARFVVDRAAFADDGRLLALGLERGARRDRSVALVDARTGAVDERATGWVNRDRSSLAWTRDGSTLVFADDRGGISALDVMSGAVERVSGRLPSPVTSLAIRSGA
jgi:hypothetical protein